MMNCNATINLARRPRLRARPSLLLVPSLRSDVICEFPLKEMLAFHKERGAEGTLLVTKVCPSFYTRGEGCHKAAGIDC